MIYILVVIVAVLLAIIVFLGMDLKKSRLNHEKRIAVLQEMIARLLDNQDVQTSKIKLSDEMNQKIDSANRVISNDILALVHDFVDTLSKNNLLKK
ncbi:MAG TPA: hypothetical protein VF676_06020 [Flavobacterium sp.]|jgi:predicted Holliday junction resolvase-like endonuclease